MRFATKMDMALFCTYVTCVFVLLFLVWPQAFCLFVYVNVWSGVTAFIMVLIGLVWLVNQLRKMVMKQ